MKRAAAFALALCACGGDDGDAPAVDAAGLDAATCGTATPWATAPDVPLGSVQETAAVAVGDKLYVLGGFNGALGVLDSVAVFDPATCAWSSGPALPRPLHHINAAVVDDTIYIVGALEGLDFRATGDAWAWRPGVDATWSARAAMPAGTQRGSAVTAALDGAIYVAGGLRSGAVAELSRYTPATDQWDALAPLPAPRDHACGGAIGGALVVAGGRQASIGSTSPAVYAFTPGGGWIERAPMPTGRGGTACGVIGDELVVVGGEGNPALPSGVFAEAEAYDHVANTWRALAPMPTPRHGMGAAVIGGRLYIPGGATQDGFGAVATHEVLTP